MKLVFWDWNGTLLNDVAYAISVRNRVFPRFGLPTIGSVAEYHAQFTFPVKDYYYRAGVTDEIFEAVANAWMDEYVRGFDGVPLFDDVVSTLDAFAEAGFSQVALSASQADYLREQLAATGILDRFDGVLGLSHIYATDKTELGRAYLAQSGVSPAEAVMIGDSLHDANVACAIGCRCALVSRGHQSREALLTAGVPVFDSLSDVAARLVGSQPAV